MADPERSPPSQPKPTPAAPRGLVGFARAGAPGPDTIVGRLLAYPARFGYVALGIGLALIAMGLARGHVGSGPAAVVIGLGWVAAESVPLSRARDRLMAIAASMALGIVLETALRWTHVIGR